MSLNDRFTKRLKSEGHDRVVPSSDHSFVLQKINLLVIYFHILKIVYLPKWVEINASNWPIVPETCVKMKKFGLGAHVHCSPFQIRQRCIIGYGPSSNKIASRDILARHGMHLFPLVE